MSKKKNSGLKIIIILILVTIIVLLIKSISTTSNENNSSSKNKMNGYASSQNTSSLTQEKIHVKTNYNPDDYKTIKKLKSDINMGDLILVNSKIPYSFSESQNLVSVYDVKNSSFKVKDKNVLLNKNITQPLNKMLEDFHDKFNDNSVIVLSGHRTYDYQQMLMDNKTDSVGAIEAVKWVAKPGGSEHHTGLALDFGILKNKSSLDYKGDGQYKWINDNAYKYGFIVRYPEEKKEQTGINYEPWHFRYVGNPHSFIINQMNICYEEYVDYIRQFEFNKKHLIITDYDNKQYEIYFTKNLAVPVPKEKEYKVSGNNVDGFIVTVAL